jgi:cobalt/nickel transport system permease protein
LTRSHAWGTTGTAAAPAGPVHRLDPRAKVCGLLAVTLVAVSAPLSAWPVLAGCAATLAVVAVVARVPAATVARRASVVLPLVLLAAVSVPFVRHGGETWAVGPLEVSEAGLALFAAAACKAVIGTVSAVLLGATTGFPATLRALRALRVPGLLVLIAGFTYRYAFVIAAEVRRMRTSLVACGYWPRTALQAASLGRVATALFLRAHARGERVYVAMLARGWRGAMPARAPLAFGRADALFLGLVAGVPLALRIGEVAA